MIIHILLEIIMKIEKLKEFPKILEKDRIIEIDSKLYICYDIGGFLSWYPLYEETNYITHIQTRKSAIWHIEHNFGTNDFEFFCYDENNSLIFPEVIFNKNSFELHFDIATKGFVSVFIAVRKYNKKVNNIISKYKSLPKIFPEMKDKIIFVKNELYICINGEYWDKLNKYLIK